MPFAGKCFADGGPHAELPSSTGSTAAQTKNTVPQGDTDTAIEKRYREEVSLLAGSSITFCPDFFDDTKLPNIYSIWTNGQLKPDLNNDPIGYLNAASAAAKLRWDELKVTPDCYAWYALYSAYNNEYEGCGNDIWPDGVRKPVKG
ncbi:hypothetical protein B0A50_08520 [Salinomyces thailandicus]|uniref:Uncharacterized protein n=1 Tax=Salinomyces thailandicus TaxID=706561 RepID=A0A4U0TJ67_9PEZI|nr:hypothetical protein B0A50_08520 [Salinomyces thailandica]